MWRTEQRYETHEELKLLSCRLIMHRTGIKAHSASGGRITAGREGGGERGRGGERETEGGGERAIKVGKSSSAGLKVQTAER